MADLQLILAGPIVRRVEPRLVAVWVALSDRRSVVLSLFEGREKTGAGTGVYTGGTPVVRGAANSLRIGNKLHVAVAVAEIPPAAQPLKPGFNYSYNVGFAPFDGNKPDGSKVDPPPLTTPVAADLKSEKLLRNQPIAGRPHLALGYEEGELPGFALPPPSLTDLRLLHGSCRRPAFTYPDDDEGTKSFDGLAWVDDLIAAWRRGTTETTAFDANVRPHQLFFTGDQIYADDVSPTMLPMLNRIGNDLVGTELLPTRYPPKNDDKSREAYVNAPIPTGFQTLEQFVKARRDAGKDPLQELKQDRRVRLLEDPCFDRAFQLVYPKTAYKVDAPADRTDKQGLHHWESTLLNFPSALRRPLVECEAQFSTSDFDNHLFSFGEFCAMYLAVWANTVWELKSDGKPALATIEQVYADLPTDLPQIWELTACFPDRKECIPRTDATGLKAYMREKSVPESSPEGSKLRREAEERKKGYAKHIAALTGFYNDLTRVRRALANIPTYMVFDDHDVTDDWNLGRAWRDRVFTAPLGRRILTSSLVAYVAFQDWGNDPLRYRQGPFREVLDRTLNYQPVTTVFDPADANDPKAVAHKRLAELFGFNQPDPETPPPKLKWHFSIDGPRHRVIALDTRNRRSFRSRYLPAGLLSEKALKEQIPDPSEQPLPAGVEILIVISQTPPVMPSLASRVIVPVLSKRTDFKNHARFRRITGTEPDNEIWPADDVAYERLLRRLSLYGKVVVLSGEVHHAFAGELSYWKKGLKRLTLDPPLEADLNTTQKPPLASQRLKNAFQAAGFTLSEVACVQVREGNDEWLVVDVRTKLMFLVRKENDGLNVYEEEEPARIAQFVSSGLKNVKGDIFKLGKLLGFAFPLTDVTPSERLIWDDNTPAPIQPPAGGRFQPAVRDRLGSEPVLLPSGNWPPGTTLESRPDFSWRSDVVQDERPDGERPPFSRPPDLPAFDPKKVTDSYAGIATAHSGLVDKFRFNRGVLYESNFGLIRFELDDGRLVAVQDLYAHPPGKDELALVNVYRVPLQVFGEERPKLRFDRPDGD